MAGRGDKSDINKKRLLEALDRQFGNVSKACAEAGVNRATFYRYRDADEEFRQAVSDIEEANLDTAESELRNLITSGNVTAIIFFLKTKGKGRGYVEPTAVAQPVDIGNANPTYHFTFSTPGPTKPRVKSEDELPDE